MNATVVAAAHSPVLAIVGIGVVFCFGVGHIPERVAGGKNILTDKPVGLFGAGFKFHSSAKDIAERFVQSATLIAVAQAGGKLRNAMGKFMRHHIERYKGLTGACSVTKTGP